MRVEQRVVGLSDALQCLKHQEIDPPVLLREVMEAPLMW